MTAMFTSGAPLHAAGGTSHISQARPNFMGIPGGENLQVVTTALTSISDDNCSAYFYVSPPH